MTLKSLRLIVVFIFLLALGAYLRFSGLNWDADWHLHPDERFLTMVSTALRWPASLTTYLDTTTSTLNPHNMGFDFYVYGTLPVLVVKAVAEVLGQGDYTNLTLIGRFISGLTDLGTLALVFLIVRKLFQKDLTALLSAGFYAVSVLPIQLSHFFAVDPYLVFFTTLSFYILIYLIKQRSIILYILLGISFGLALASKISAIIFAPIIAISFFLSLIQSKRPVQLFLLIIIFFTTLYFTLRLAQPYLFAASPIPFFGHQFLYLKLNPEVVADWTQLKSFEGSDVWFPPAVQWINTTSFIFPLINLIWVGLGLPAALVALLSIPNVLVRHRRSLVVLALIWIIGLFTYQGAQFVKALRYFYPIYPFLAITAGVFLSDLYYHHKKFRWVLVPVLISLLVWPLSFSAIYRRPHTRVAASQWINSHIPSGSRISCEYWDDCLPLGSSSSYTIVQLSLYDPDTPQKWQGISALLSDIDYIVLSSNRLYGSIVNTSNRYPISSRFYTLLFTGQLGFVPIAEFSSRPYLSAPLGPECFIPPGLDYGSVSLVSLNCSQPGLTFVDDFADESFTVYDHPKVTVFRKIKQIDTSFLSDLNH